MSQHFIDDIKIENFKCFENLAITGFKRVNLFGGKNNVGKTALLEAIFLFTVSCKPLALIQNLIFTLNRRQKSRNENKRIELDVFYLDVDCFLISCGSRVISVSKNRLINHVHNGISNLLPAIYFKVDNDEFSVPMENFINLNLGVVKEFLEYTFLDSCRVNDDKIAILYGMIIENSKEAFVDASLNEFDSQIVSFKIVPVKNEVRPKLKLRNRNSLVSLAEMGDGINRYVAILCAIWASQNGFLFIDEIENGIHYSNYKKLWELIFMASEQANCQVFVTSHSKECIDAFNQVQLERSDNMGMYFELYHSERKKRIVAAGRDAEQLHYSLTHGAAIRGE